eukprot:2739576-Pleurochrysis_carterae.AAC.2
MTGCWNSNRACVQEFVHPVWIARHVRYYHEALCHALLYKSIAVVNYCVICSPLRYPVAYWPCDVQQNLQWVLDAELTIFVRPATPLFK